MSSSNRMIRLMALLLSLLLLFGCSSAANSGGPGLYADVSAASDSSRMQLVEVTMGTIGRNVSGEGVILYPDEEQITFNDFVGKTLTAVYVKNGDSVEPGDVLAEFEAVYSEADLETLRSSLSIAHKQFAIQRNGLTAAVTAAEQSLTAARAARDAGMGSDREVRKAQLRLESARIDLASLTTTEQSSIAALEQQISDYEANIENVQLKAERAGIIKDVAYITAGTLVTPGMVLCSIYSPDVFWLGCSVDAANAMRYNQEVTVTVTKEPTEYHGRIVSSPNILGGVTGRVTILPEDFGGEKAAAFTDRMKRITILASRFELENVMIVPSSAVANEEGSRFVYLYEDGVVKKRYVTVGLQDTTNIQILDGLELGQTVVVG